MAQGTAATERSLAELLRQATGERPQWEVAEELGVHQSRLSRWLRGEPPADNKVPAIARFLGMPEEEVVALVYRTRRVAEARAPGVAPLDERVQALERDLSALRRDVQDLTSMIRDLTGKQKPAKARKRTSRR